MTIVLFYLVLRRRIAHEILDTERKYCSCLWTLTNHFGASLRQADIILPADIELVQSCDEEK